MLTMARLTNAEDSVEYYEADDYYCSGDAGRAPSVWFGRGAEELGLTGEIDRTVFRSLLHGELPDGTTLSDPGHAERRPGWDCTLSAPKSVSMQALIAGDKRLVEAHEEAVSAALRFVESRIAGYRETADGITSRADAKGIVVARIRHELSRNADPQLHTHAVLLNVALTSKGGWRCFDARRLYRQQKLVGAVYRAELAKRVVELGFDIRIENADGRFELAHITREQITAFSTRWQAIARELEKEGRDVGASSPREREIANLASRPAKVAVDRTAVWQQWDQRARDQAVDFTPRAPSIVSNAQRQTALSEGVSFAIAHTTERSAVVKDHQLLAAALGRVGALGGAEAISGIEREITARLSTGELISDGSRYTSAEAVRVEEEILAFERDGRGRVQSIVPQLWFAELDACPLNPGQRQTARTILTTKNRVIGVNGWAGTGKTTLLAYVREIAEERGYTVIGLAPSAVAARQLGSSGIESETIAAFLAREATPDRNTLVVVDEAGMVGARDMHAVLKAVERGEARVVLVGDELQLKAVAAGAPFAQLQKNEMETEHLTEILRQKNPILGEAVSHSTRRDVRSAIAKLRGTTAEIASAEKRWAAIARQYVRLTPAERAETVIISGTNSARDGINAVVRTMLGLSGKGHEVEALRPMNLTLAERRSTASYAVGDVIEPIKAYKLTAIDTRAKSGESVSPEQAEDRVKWANGAQAVVKAIRDGKVELELADGRHALWLPSGASHVSAFRRVKLELTQGDLLRVTANDYRRNVLNGDVLTVTAIDKDAGRVDLMTASGAAVAIHTCQALHIEHGYASTVHSAQGRTVDRVIFDACTRSASAHESLFYTGISRARHEAWIYTDDREALPDAMSRADEKEKALDVVEARKNVVTERAA